MSETLAFLARYADWKLIKTRGVVQIVFELDLRNSNKAYEALGGMPNFDTEVVCGIARVKIAGNTPLLPEASAREAESSKAATPASASRLITRAVMLAKEPLFRRFVELETKALMGTVTEYGATEYIRSTCGVVSRSEIVPGTVAADRFAFILSAYTLWTEKDRYVAA